MGGVPVLLASLSRRSTATGRTIATGLWSESVRAESAAMLRRLLGPAGNPARERLFRMNVTLCLHRALTADEVDALPAYFHADPPTDLAGGPVEVLWESERGAASTRPCEDPVRADLGGGPLLWVPFDCGSCPPCVARAALFDRPKETV
jgi:hypothetical protein